MIRLEKLHEKESFHLRFDGPIDGQSVIAYFESIGAQLEDDFFFEERKEKVSPWQTSSFYTAHCLLSDSAAYPDESQVDCLVFDYLFSSTPARCFLRFTEILQQTAGHFHNSIQHGGRVISKSDLEPMFESWVRDLEDEISEEPGTESLAILIQQLFYQR